MSRRAVTQKMRDDYLEWEAAATQSLPKEQGLPSTAERPKRGRQMLFADSLPGLESIHVSPDGLLWIVDAMAPKDFGWTATAFRLDGSITGRLQSKKPGMPMAFNRDRVVVRKLDSNGVVTLETYRLVPDKPS